MTLLALAENKSRMVISKYIKYIPGCDGYVDYSAYQSSYLLRDAHVLSHPVTECLAVKWLHLENRKLTFQPVQRPIISGQTFNKVNGYHFSITRFDVNITSGIYSIASKITR